MEAEFVEARPSGSCWPVSGSDDLLDRLRHALIATRPATPSNGAARYDHTRVVHAAPPLLGAITTRSPLPSLIAMTGVSVVPGSTVRICTGMGSSSALPEGQGATDHPSDGEEQFTVLESDNDEEGQVQVLAWILRTGARHRIYRLSHWPIFPSVCAAVAAAS